MRRLQAEERGRVPWRGWEWGTDQEGAWLQSLEEGIGGPGQLPGFWELRRGLWGKGALHPHLPPPPGNDLLWASGLPAASAPGRRFQKEPQPPVPTPLPALLAQMGLLSRQHPGRPQERVRAKVAHSSEAWGLFSLHVCVSACVCAGAHKVTVRGRDDEAD